MKLTVSQLRSIIAEEVKKAARAPKKGPGSATSAYGHNTGYEGPVEYIVVTKGDDRFGYVSYLTVTGILEGAVADTNGSMFAKDVGRPELMTVAGGKGVGKTREQAISNLSKLVEKEIVKLEKNSDLRPSQVKRLELLQGFLDNGANEEFDVPHFA